MTYLVGFGCSSSALAASVLRPGSSIFFIVL
jgi:hypothetical protein